MRATLLIHNINVKKPIEESVMQMLACELMILGRVSTGFKLFLCARLMCLCLCLSRSCPLWYIATKYWGYAQSTEGPIFHVSAIQDADTSPGPGHYDLPTTWGRQGPAFSIAAKPHRELNPGHCSDASAPSSDNSSNDGENGGAGGQKRRHCNPSSKGKHSKRSVPAAAVGPGPGEYETCRSRWGAEGPAYSIRGRPRSPGKEVTGPGPGEHQQMRFR